MSVSECKPERSVNATARNLKQCAQPSIKMLSTARLLVFVFLPIAAMAQTPPPGSPYDPARYPNPIITFVEDKDFKDADYAQVRKDAGIEILGLSQSEGKSDTLAIAPGRFVKTMTLLGN